MLHISHLPLPNSAKRRLTLGPSLPLLLRSYGSLALALLQFPTGARRQVR